MPEWDDDPDLRARGETGRREYRQSANSNGHDQNPPWREIEIIGFDDIKANLETRPLVKDVLEHEQESLVFGDTGCGKTFLALDQSIHIAWGEDWLGHKVDQGTTIYIAAEAGRSLFKRIAAIKITKGLVGIPFFAIPTTVDLCHPGSGDLKQLITAIKNATSDRISLITIDTVSRALAGGDENASDDMGAFVKAMDCLRDEFGAHVSAVHHCGKNHALGARGHSLLRANIDTEIEVAFTPPSPMRIATVTKQRDGETGVLIPFRLRQTGIGYNADGDPVYSCIVEPGDPTAVKARRKEKLTDKQKIALGSLEHALKKHGTVAPEHQDIPPGVTVVTASIWRQIHMGFTAADEQSEDTRRKAWREARDALIVKGYASMISEMVWIL
jgi:AAA domain